MNKTRTKALVFKIFIISLVILFGVPANFNIAHAETATQSSGSGGGDFKNPISAGSVSALLTDILNNLKGVILTLAIVFLMIGGIMYLISGGNEKMITRAKACITGAIIGLVLALGAPIFLNEIIKIFGGTSGSTALNTSQLSGYPSLKDVLEKILNLLLSILGTLAMISLVIGGGMYLTTYGDEERIKLAKKIITYSIIGIVVSLSALIIVKQIGTLLGAI
jgi:hypothetical protein